MNDTKILFEANTDDEDTPWAPPREWFESTPEWLDDTWEQGLIQIHEGRVAALVAPYKECILDGSKNCWTAPESPTKYEFAHVGALRTAEGDTIRVANVGGGVGHFNPALPTAMSPAVDHYANSASRVMVGRYHDRPDLGGIVFLGAMWPGAGVKDEVLARASALSGDWRWVDSLSSYDMAGAQLVNNPGFRPTRVREAPSFAIVAAVGGAEALFGHWMPAPVPVRQDITDRLALLEKIVVALLMDADEPDEPLTAEDIAECEKWIPWYDDDGHPVTPKSPDHPHHAYTAGQMPEWSEEWLSGEEEPPDYTQAWWADEEGPKVKTAGGRKKHSRRPNPKSTPKEIVGSHGHRPHGPSILWPALYEHLRAKGMTKRKAAMISNGQWRKKRGLPPKSVKGTKGKVRVPS